MSMPFFTVNEFIDMVVMIAFVGFIFMDMFKKPRMEDYDPLKGLNRFGFDWQSFWFAAIVVAPGILLHELGHKFSAMALGMNAVFHAAYLWLLIGLVLKMVNFGFIFFVPAYVNFSGGGPMANAVVAFMGPFINLLLWLFCFIYLKYGKPKKKYVPILVLTKRINIFLFIFNMIPIPPFDGYHFFSNLIKVLFF